MTEREETKTKYWNVGWSTVESPGDEYWEVLVESSEGHLRVVWKVIMVAIYTLIEMFLRILTS